MNRLVLLSFVFAACVDEVGVDNAQDRWVDAMCDQSVRCGNWPTKAECLQTAPRGIVSVTVGGTDYGSLRAILDSAKAGKVVADWRKFEVCVEQERSRACETGGMLAMLPSRSVFPSYNPCPEAFTGTLAAGEHCITDVSCAPRSACQIELEKPCEGTCKALPAGDCVQTFDCGAGEVCESYRCRPFLAPGGKGEKCGNFSRCQAGLTCLYTPPVDGVAQPSRCGVAPALGDACELQCAEGLCDPESKICVLPRSAGTACTKSAQCEVDHYCEPSTLSCTPLPSSGPCAREPEEPGSLGGFARCAFRTAYCDGSVTPFECRPYRPRGAACPVGNECAPGLSCRTQGAERTCADPLSDAAEAVACTP